MLSKLIKIGNSQGVMLPKVLLEEAGLKGQVELKAEKNAIHITAVEKPVRDGWEASFRAMGEAEKENLFPNVQNSFDDQEWEWK